MTIIRKTTNNKCWWRYGKKGTLRYCWWEGKMTSHYANSTGIPQKVKNRTTISNNSTVGYSFKENKALIRKDICTFMFIVALFTSVKIWKQPMCPPINRWMDKDLFLSLSHTHTQKYYSSIKKNEILPFVTSWIDWEDIILSEISQTKKEKYGYCR